MSWRGTFDLCRWNIPFLCCVLKCFVFREIILLLNSHTLSFLLSMFSWPLLNTHFPHTVLSCYFCSIIDISTQEWGPRRSWRQSVHKSKHSFTFFPPSFHQLFLFCIVVTLSSRPFRSTAVSCSKCPDGGASCCERREEGRAGGRRERKEQRGGGGGISLVGPGAL